MSDFIQVEWYLPREILIDIFRRIPIVSLARCSCVATSWQEVIKKESSLKRKIGLERAWLHEPIKPIVHRSRKCFSTFRSAKLDNFIALGGLGYKVFDFDRREFIFESEKIRWVRSLSFMDGMLVTGSKGDLCGWDISTWKKLFCVPILDTFIFSIADLGNNVAIAGRNGDLQIWGKGIWEMVGSLQGHKDQVTCLLPQPDNLLISGSMDETIRLWNLVDNVCLRVIHRQKRGASAMDVSDGLIFCGAWDGIIRSWELESGQHVQIFRGHKSYVTSVVVKGGRMFTGSGDRTIKIWDTIKGECERSFDCSHNLGQFALQRVDVLRVDHEYLVAIGALGEILEWDFSKGV